MSKQKMNILSNLIINLVKEEILHPNIEFKHNWKHVAKKIFESFSEGPEDSTLVSEKFYKCLIKLPKNIKKKDIKTKLISLLHESGVKSKANGSNKTENSVNYTLEHAAPRAEAYEDIKQMVIQGRENEVYDFIHEWFSFQSTITSDEDLAINDAGYKNKRGDYFLQRYEKAGIKLVYRETGKPYEC